VAAFSLLALVLVLRPAHRAAGVAADVDVIGIRADAAAKWSRRPGIRREEVILESGTLSIHVERAASSGRGLVVILPDGELEDTGTTFSVSADGERTTGVRAQDGSIVLRLRGRPPVALSAGESWQSPPASVPVPSTISHPFPVAPHETNPTSRALQNSHGSAATARAPIATARAVDLAAHAAGSADDFRKAVSALNRGDHALAVAFLTAFMTEHPRDSRTEDAAYLRILDLHRAGNAGGLKDAASQYLRRLRVSVAPKSSGYLVEPPDVEPPVPLSPCRNQINGVAAHLANCVEQLLVWHMQQVAEVGNAY
jgi:hypothetical protein